jgi:hypothetical protein
VSPILSDMDHISHEALDSQLDYEEDMNKRPFIPDGCTQQGRHQPTIPAEACSELLEDDDRPGHARPIGPVLRFFLNDSPWRNAALIVVAFVLLLWVTKP